MTRGRILPSGVNEHPLRRIFSHGEGCNHHTSEILLFCRSIRTPRALLANHTACHELLFAQHRNGHCMFFPLFHRAGHCFAQTAFCPATGFIKIHIVVHSSTHRASYIFFSHNIASQKHQINTFPVPNQHQKAVIRGFDSIIHPLFRDANYAFAAILEISY